MIRFLDVDKLELNKTAYHHEIHITVECDRSLISDFRKLCSDIGVKCTVIDLMNSENEIHVMTSSVVKCSTALINYYIYNLHLQIEPFFNIIRTKVEVPPNCIEEQLLPYKYFELHVPCKKDMLYQAEKLVNDGWAKSRNFKRPDVIDITKRESDISKLIDIDFDLQYLIMKDIVIEGFKPLYEFAIIDTNPELDSNWIK